MKQPLFIVTGAPGAGKSAALVSFLTLSSGYLAFDIDWLTESASKLTGKSIIFDNASWAPYRAVWLEVMHSVHKNARTPVLFASIDKPDLAPLHTNWAASVEWLLLDCSDSIREERLNGRANWTTEMLKEAKADAAALRETIQDVIDTTKRSPGDVAQLIRDWLQAKTL
jgi:RNase adaptor protein for sRNA GlmZ degradation